MGNNEKRFLSVQLERIQQASQEKKDAKELQLFMESCFNKQINVHKLKISTKKAWHSGLTNLLSDNTAYCKIENDILKTYKTLDLDKIEYLEDEYKNKYFIEKRLLNTETFKFKISDEREEKITLICYKFLDKIEEKLTPITINQVNNEIKNIDKSKLINKGIIGDNNTANVDKKTDISIKANLGYKVDDNKI